MLLDRRGFLGTAAASILGIRSNRPAVAETPVANIGIAPHHRFEFDDVAITAISDGMIDLPLSLFPAAREEVRDSFPDASAASLPCAINAFVIEAGGSLFLIDAGHGNIMGPTAGALFENLRAAGFAPGQFDAVVLTHMLPDHAGGLLDGRGRPAFERAALLIAEKEYAFWTDESAAIRAPEAMRKFFHMARTAIEPYASRVRLYRDGELLHPNITALAAPGRTSGHMSLRVAAARQIVLICGDAVQLIAQLARPDWAMSLDHDQSQAIATRKRLFDEAAADGMLVAAAHLAFPGIGRVSRQGDGYVWAASSSGTVPASNSASAAIAARSAS